MHISGWQKFISLVFGLSLIFSVRAESLDDKFLQTQWTSENGLPQNSVMAIAQTSEGYLWIATFGGLARFDGVRFKVFTTANTPQLKNNRIITLATDHDQNLWIGTERGEVLVYRDGVFRMIDDGKKYEYKIANDIFVDDKGIVWVSGWNGGRICHLQTGCSPVEFPGKIVLKVRQDSAGRHWGIADYQLQQLTDGKFVPDESFKKRVVNIEPNSNGGLWVVSIGELGTYHNGKYAKILDFDKDITITALKNSDDGTLWFNVRETLYRIKNGQIDTYRIKNVNTIGRQIFIDNEENIWIGRNLDGLFRLLNRRVENLILETEVKKNLPSAIAVNSIAQDRDGNIWMATNPNLFRWQNGKAEKIPAEIAGTSVFARGSLLVDSDGTLWNATSQGLQSFQNGKFTFHQDISWQQSQTGNNLFEDSKKNLWCGCDGCGVIVSDKQKILAKYSTENGLVDNWVTIIKETRDGAIWLGTKGGVSRLQNGIFTNFTTANGLSNDVVRDIYEDQDGTLWFGTYGGGLNRFRDGKWTIITTKDGLFDDIVSRILVDDNDNFWMLGNRGIYSVSRQMLNDFADGHIRKIFCAIYTTADGMVNSEGNGGFQGAGIRARDGKFWFPMINGLVIIDPNQSNSPPPKPLIEEILMERGTELKSAGKIELYHDLDDLEIHYTAISFRKPEGIRFRYRLLGFETNEDWEEVGTRRIAYYPKIPPGQYRFQVIAANSDGSWSSEIAEFEIIVHPPFYLTWWFTVLCVLLVFNFILMAFLYRNWQFAREKTVREEFTRKILNAQELERRRIAAEIHDNLGQQLLIIKNWATYCLGKISKNSTIRGQINQINDTAEIALNDMRSIAKNLSPYHLDKVGLTTTIQFMVKQVAESCEIDFRTELDNIDGILPKEKEINLYRIVQESMSNIIKHSQATKAKVVLEKTENSLKLRVTDNGIGFDQTAKHLYFSTGLNGMMERAQMLNGTLAIKSIQNKGTEILVEIKI